MTRDSSWTASALQYVKLYRSLRSWSGPSERRTVWGSKCPRRGPP